jgi:hypothetical protein
MNSNYDLRASSLRQMQGASLQATSLFPKTCNAVDGVRMELVSLNLNSFEYIMLESVCCSSKKETTKEVCKNNLSHYVVHSIPSAALQILAER